MNIKLAVLTAACAFLSIGTVAAQDKAERKTTDTSTPAKQTAPNPAPRSFGSGFNVAGPGGSVSSMTGGVGSPSGSGGQGFGSGFTGSSPLSTPARGAGG